LIDDIKDIIKNKKLVINCLVFSLLVALALFPFRASLLNRIKVGKVSPVTIKAPKDFVIVDEARTEKLKQQVLEDTPKVFRLDASWTEKAYKEISDVFYLLRGLDPASGSYFEDARKVLKEKLGFELPGRDLEVLAAYNFSFYTEGVIAKVLKMLKNEYIIKNDAIRSREVFVYDPDLNRLKSVPKTYIYHVSGIKGLVKRIVDDILPFDKKKLESPIVNIVSHMVSPTLKYDPAWSEKILKERLASVKPVSIKVKSGEVIVREGEIVTEDAYKKLTVLKKHLNLPSVFSICLGNFVLALVISFVLTVVWQFIYAGRIEFVNSHRLFLFLIFETLITVRLFIWIYSRIFSPYFAVNSILLNAAAPLFFVGVFSAFVFGFPSYLVPVIGAGALISFMPSSTFYTGAIAVISSVAAGEWVKRRRGPNAIFWGIMAGATALFLMLLGIYVLKGFRFPTLFVAPFFASVSVFFVSFATLPVVEHVFNVVTDLKLLELANLDHPLLKQLLDKAPGTYNHSMIVGILAEASAKEVDANPILAKVGGFFHDIGKLKNPKYFIENTMGVSMHEKLSPHMSRLIIISHVKDGVELAKKYKLPQCVIDIIQQHHGTSLISYFYHKAKKQSKGEVDEEAYRYPGPKPRSKEAAIVMIADSVEAAVRSLDEPSPSKIKATVSSIINNIFMDGQLDECDLTLKDIKKISEILTKMLISIYHKRIAYPQDEEGKNGCNNNKQSSTKTEK